MNLEVSTVGSIELSGSKQFTCIAVNPVAKLKLNIMVYGYANNSDSNIGNGIASNTSVSVIRNAHVEV